MSDTHPTAGHLVFQILRLPVEGVPYSSFIPAFVGEFGSKYVGDPSLLDKLERYMAIAEYVRPDFLDRKLFNRECATDGRLSIDHYELIENALADNAPARKAPHQRFAAVRTNNPNPTISWTPDGSLLDAPRQMLLRDSSRANIPQSYAPDSFKSNTQILPHQDPMLSNMMYEAMMRWSASGDAFALQNVAPTAQPFEWLDAENSMLGEIESVQEENANIFDFPLPDNDMHKQAAEKSFSGKLGDISNSNDLLTPAKPVQQNTNAQARSKPGKRKRSKSGHSGRKRSRDPVKVSDSCTSPHAMSAGSKSRPKRAKSVKESPPIFWMDSQTGKFSKGEGYVSSVCSSPEMQREKRRNADVVDLTNQPDDETESLSQFLSNWDGPIEFSQLKRALADTYPAILYEYQGSLLIDRFLDSDSERSNLISRVDFDIASTRYGSLDILVGDFLVDGYLLLLRELEFRGINDFLKNTPLIAAAAEGYEDIVRSMLQTGKAKIDVKVPASKLRLTIGKEKNVPATGMNALQIACIYRNVEICKQLIAHGASVNLPKTADRSCLHIAISQEDEDLVKLLIESGALLNRQCKGAMPLYDATDSQNMAICKLLMASGANVKGSTDDKWTALHGSCSIGHLGLTRLYMTAGADIEAKSKDGCSALDIAVKFDQLDSVIELLEAGSNTESKDVCKYTPLHVACWKGFLEPCKLLIRAGADIEALTDQKRTPLHKAAMNGHADVCQHLIEHGANKEAVDCDGCTPLHVCISFENGDDTNCVETLLKSGCVSTSLSYHNQTLLHLAVGMGKAHVCRMLLDHENVFLDLDELDGDGHTALYNAVVKRDAKCVEHLLQFDNNLELIFEHQETLLHVAVQKGSYGVLAALLDYNVALDAVDATGNTALHIAVNGNKKKMVRILLDCGAKQVRNSEQLLPMDIAIRKGYSEVWNML